MDNPIEKLVHEFSRLPGIGEKTATRLAYFVMKESADYARSFAQALIEVKEKIKFCSVCCNLADRDPCLLCKDPRRDRSIICIVEDPSDVTAIEKTFSHKGLYHVLHGAVAPLDGISPDDLKMKELLARLQNGEVKEIIIATNPSVEGEATSLYISRLVKPLNIKLTRIASGVPIGCDLEYIDQVTLTRAIESRREL